MCGKIHSFTLPAAHTYKTVENKPSTCTEEGEIKKVCSECGNEETETTTVEEQVTTPAYQESDLEKKDRGYGIITWYDAEKEDWFCKQGQFEMSMKREISGNGAFTDGLWVECGTLDNGRLYDKQAGKWVNAGDSVDCYFDVDSRTWKNT